MCIHIYLNHFAVHQNITLQINCTSIKDNLLKKKGGEYQCELMSSICV